MGTDSHSVAAEACRHTGGQMCARCSWQRPYQAALLLARGRTARKALPVAAIVGTVLSLVNQGCVIVGGTATASTWVRVAVNYAVPFLVASVGYLSGRRVPAETAPWPRYLAQYHADRPGITELILARAVDRRGKQPYRWLAEALDAAPDPVLDLACGSAPTRALQPRHAWLGVDASAAELAVATGFGRGPVVVARADQLPLGDDSMGAVCAAMCLPVLTPLDAVLAELRRVLRPGGILVALVPSRIGLNRSVLSWWQAMRALSIRTPPWPNPHARDGVSTVLRAHGFVVDASERRVFWREIPGPEAAAQVVDGLYLPGVEAERRAAATQALSVSAGPGRRLPFPLRRVIAHLPADR